ncbi:hypothetical protein LPJ66_002953 [Kickxella alabastrina]|uniref:Uncharacterized protein n=1 Tax=Kickxella alabastrina TaxID=61397 RepID=A0ACC1IM10_9FUNG|nr:hypothetical protein LPJ66_002953 [Kickxella alabastrina]
MGDYEREALLIELADIEKRLKNKESMQIIKEHKIVYALRTSLVKGNLYFECKFTDRNPEVKIIKRYLRECEAKMKHLEKIRNSWQSIADLYNMKSAELCYDYKRGKIEDKDTVTDAEDDLERMWTMYDKFAGEYKTAREEHDELRDKLKTIYDEYRDAYTEAKGIFLEG